MPGRLGLVSIQDLSSQASVHILPHMSGQAPAIASFSKTLSLFRHDLVASTQPSDCQGQMQGFGCAHTIAPRCHNPAASNSPSALTARVWAQVGEATEAARAARDSAAALESSSQSKDRENAKLWEQVQVQSVPAYIVSIVQAITNRHCACDSDSGCPQPY